MKHPLCQIEQSIDWLIKPVNNLLDRIKSLDQRTHTRSSLQDVSMGKYIFHRSAYCNATDFVCSSDDVELIDFVENDSTTKIWHCSDLLRSEMLRKAVIAAYTLAVNNEERYRNVPEWLSLIESARSKVGKSCHIKFLGLVSLFESKSGNKIVAFRLHCFLLYLGNEKTKSTRVHLLLSEQRLSATSAPERMLQILQLIQSDLFESTAVTIKPEFTMSEDLVQTYVHLGFSKETSSKNKDVTILAKKLPIIIPKFTNRVMWGRYGKYLCPREEYSDGYESVIQLQCRLVSQLLLRKVDPASAIGI